MPKKTFELHSTDPGDDPIEFDLAYTKKGVLGRTTREIAHFVCLPEQPAIAARFLTIESSGLAAAAFIERCLASDDDAARWLHLVNDRATLIREEDLADVLEWLCEQYAQRPFGTAELSLNGSTPTGGSLTDDSASTVPA